MTETATIQREPVVAEELGASPGPSEVLVGDASARPSRLGRSPYRRVAVLFVLLVACAVLGRPASVPSCHADDRAATSGAEDPITRRARLAREAAAKGDSDALARLAEEDAKFNWVVVDVLREQGDAVACVSFAKSCGGSDASSLLAYAEGGTRPLLEGWPLMREADGLAARGRIESALAILNGAKIEPNTAMAVLAAVRRAEYHAKLGHPRPSVEAYVAGARIARGIGWQSNCASIAIEAGVAAYGLELPEVAQEAFQLAFDAQIRLHDRPGAANSSGDLGSALATLGRWADAEDAFARAIEFHSEGGNEGSVAIALRNRGLSRSRRGELAKAMSDYAEATAILRRLGRRDDELEVLALIGSAFHDVGDWKRAEEIHRRVLDLRQEMSDAEASDTTATVEEHAMRLRALAQGLADARANLAMTLSKEGRGKEAQDAMEAALDSYEKQGGKTQDVAQALQGSAQILSLAGEHQRARFRIQAAIGKWESEKNQARLAQARVDCGDIDARAKRLPEAIGNFKQALVAAQEGDVLYVAVDAWRGMASARLGSGDLRGAIDAAWNGHKALGVVFAGLAEGEGAIARSKVAELYESGLTAAASLGDLQNAYGLLEAGRAGSLLESLGGRSAYSAASVPVNLRRGETDAREAVRTALRAWTEMPPNATRAETAKRVATLETARSRLRDARLAVQRAARSAATLAPTAATPLDAVIASLAADEAIAEFGFVGNDLTALVVRRTGARFLKIPGASDLRAAIDDYLPPERPGVEGTPAIVEAKGARVRALLWDPLALEASIRRVYVSPDGPISRVPFQAFQAADSQVEVVMIPSITSLGFLRAQEKALSLLPASTRVLALGDPAYREGSAGALGGTRRPLRSIPHTNAEAKAVGDDPLLAGDATFANLVKRLSSAPHWRAVHLACHGLIDEDTPLLSGLAVTPTAEHDGLITLLDLYALSTPADLVTLSACRSGRGPAVRGEGVMGLMRGFMYAGAPRVLVSLWDVDDAATKELMIDFYSRWKGGKMRASQALREAQTEMRKHRPAAEFWAGWTIWGLP